MRRALFAIAMACAGGCASPRAEVPMVTLAACPTVPAHDLPVSATAAATMDNDNDARRADIRAELDRVDRELDAVDDELARAEVTGGMGKYAALAETIEAGAVLAKIVFPAVVDGAPGELEAIRARYYQAKIAAIELEHDLGPTNPEVRAAERGLAVIAGEFDAQLALERAAAQALADELSALPRDASMRAVRGARLRAIKTSIANLSAQAPTSAPAAVRVAAWRVGDLARELDQVAELYGPKHPQRVRLDAELDLARHALHDAVSAATVDLDRTLAALADKTLDPPAVDPSLVSRRAALSERARELRRTYELLAR